MNCTLLYIRVVVFSNCCCWSYSRTLCEDYRRSDSQYYWYIAVPVHVHFVVCWYMCHSNDSTDDNGFRYQFLSFRSLDVEPLPVRSVHCLVDVYMLLCSIHTAVWGSCFLILLTFVSGIFQVRWKLEYFANVRNLTISANLAQDSTGSLKCRLGYLSLVIFDIFQVVIGLNDRIGIELRDISDISSLD